MINKILSNLPFNPSLISQVSFYAKRLRQESSIRRLGLVMVALAMVLQIFVALSPPEKSLAYSDTNLINGVRTRDDIIAAWKRAGSDIPSIYGYFGVTLADLQNLPKYPDTTIKSDAADYWSTGRLSLSGFSNIDPIYKQNELAIDVGPTTIYMRQLHAWDTHFPYSLYHAFHGHKKSDGKDFWIVVDCGNYIQIHKVENKQPVLDIKKTVSPNTAIKPGDQLRFRIEYRNKITGSLAENALLEDQLDLAHFDVVSPKNLPLFGNVVRYKIGNLPYSSTYKVLDITVKLKTTLSSPLKICNTAVLSASNATKVQSSVCSGTVNTGPDTPPGQLKTVKNITQNLDGEAALGTKVKAGDELEYSLVTTNTTNHDKLHYVVEDYIGDLLDYASLDQTYLKSQGGSFDATTKKVSWFNQTLKANSDTVKKFRIKMKDPLPSTNTPTNLSTAFDCKISNEYGNEISLDVACPFVKNIENLPNTGPGTTVIIAFGVTVFSAYFFARSRLLAKELELVKEEQVVSGGI